MLALKSNDPKSGRELAIREKCALAMLAKYMHENMEQNTECSEYYMTTPNSDIITMPYALGVLDKIVDDM